MKKFLHRFSVRLVDEQGLFVNGDKPTGFKAWHHPRHGRQCPLGLNPCITPVVLTAGLPEKHRINFLFRNICEETERVKRFRFPELLVPLLGRDLANFFRAFQVNDDVEGL